jgi:uncharacterized protein (TIGR03435 family)
MNADKNNPFLSAFICVHLRPILFGTCDPSADRTGVRPSYTAAGIRRGIHKTKHSPARQLRDNHRKGSRDRAQRYLEALYARRVWRAGSADFRGAKWVDEDRYDIDAKAAGPAGDRELMVMLQSLLAERFKLVFHRETRPLNGYALVVGKNGPLAKQSAPDAPSRTNSRRGAIEAERCAMGQLAQKLSESLHLPVADLTAVEGRFDFKLEWTPEDMQAKLPASAELAPGPSIFAAVEQQLGLKLEPRKVPTEVLVIDRAEKASAN